MLGLQRGRRALRGGRKAAVSWLELGRSWGVVSASPFHQTPVCHLSVSWIHSPQPRPLLTTPPWACPSWERSVRSPLSPLDV